MSIRPLAYFLAVVCLTQPAVASDGDLSALDFLKGDWEAVAKPGQGAGRCSFTSELQGRVIVRRNYAEVPAANGRPAGTHDDLMIIYREGDPPVLRATYHDSEDHVIRYSARGDGSAQVTFLSEPAPNAPRYRLSYAKLADGRVSGKFEVAPAAKPEGFNTYLEWTMQHPAAARVQEKKP